MPKSRDVRRAALQALYQLDARGDDDATLVHIRQSLEGSPGDERTHQRGFEFAKNVWEHRSQSDAFVSALSEAWPIHRQPVVDRNLLRLAIYEMLHTDTPPKVAINEAVELAKEFSTERSPMFINGILDKVFKQQIRDAAPAATAETDEGCAD